MATPTHRPHRGRLAATAVASVVLVVVGLVLFVTAGSNRPGDPTQAVAGAPGSTSTTPYAPSLPPPAGAAAGGSVSTPSSPGHPSPGAVADGPVSSPGSDAGAPGQPAPASGPGAAVPSQPGSSASDPGSTTGGGTSGIPGVPIQGETPGNPGNAAVVDTGAGSGVSDAARAAARAATPPTMPPNTLALPTLNVGPSPLGPICAEPGGILEPPANSIGMLCDWRGSASLDAGAGMTTLAGHINFNRLPNAAFARLSQMSPGDAIFTSSPSGQVQAWVVTRRYELPKTQQLDAGAFAGPDGPRQLVLLSCGGALSGRSYLNNVYVDAVPV